MLSTFLANKRILIVFLLIVSSVIISGCSLSSNLGQKVEPYPYVGEPISSASPISSISSNTTVDSSINSIYKPKPVDPKLVPQISYKAFVKRIQDWSHYSVVTDELEKSYSIYSNCPEYDAFLNKTIKGVVKKIGLLNIKNDVYVYSTPNYENWSTEQFRGVNKCADGVGQNQALGVVQGHLLWGQSGCGGIDESYDPNFLACEKIDDQLDEYVKTIK